jgi:uncharacterized protein (TIGR00266 family)
MQHEVTHKPGFAMLRVDLDPSEKLVSEPGAMVAMSRTIELSAKMSADANTGFFAKLVMFWFALVKKFIGGESIMFNHYDAPQKGQVWLSPTYMGDIHHRSLTGETLYLAKGAYLASTGSVDISVKFGGFKAFIMPWKSSFKLVATGTGDLYFNSYGGIQEIQVDGSYVVDDGHIVAYEGSLVRKTKSVGGGLTGLFASGEGLVKEFQGQGTVYIQTRNRSALADWLTPMLPA